MLDKNFDEPNNITIKRGAKKKKNKKYNYILVDVQ